METFSVLLTICAGNSPVTGEFPPQRPVTRSFGVFFDLCRLSKQSCGWWFETPSHSLWRLVMNSFRVLSLALPVELLVVSDEYFEETGRFIIHCNFPVYSTSNYRIYLFISACFEDAKRGRWPEAMTLQHSCLHLSALLALGKLIDWYTIPVWLLQGCQWGIRHIHQLFGFENCLVLRVLWLVDWGIH